MINQIFFTNILSSILSLILGFFFGAIGIIGILIPWSPNVRSDVVQFLLEDSIALSIFGFVFFVIGLTIFVNIILSIRKRYYHLRSGHPLVVVDEALFQQYLDGYWKKLFPNYEVGHSLILKRNKLHITAELPFIPQSQQKLLLERIRSDLSDLFSRMLGYRGEFFLSASFRSRSE